MRTGLLDRLNSIARRQVGTDLADDVVQDALLIAVEQGQLDFDNSGTARWLSGVVRNRARMAARSARRGRRRDGLWQQGHSEAPGAPGAALPEILAGLSPALRSFAALVLTGHNRREIAYLLQLPDTALRQRVTALRRHLVARDLVAPTELSGLYLDLAYGRIRDALLPALHRHQGVFASHDPDGHLFLVRRSQTGPARQ